MRRTILASLALLASAEVARAVTAGYAGGDFLTISRSPRATALGGSFLAYVDGNEAIEWNPAGLASVRHKTFTVLHTEYVRDLGFEHAAYSQPFNDWGPIGQALTVLHLPGIPYEVEDPNTGRYLGNFGKYSALMLAYQLAWAQTRDRLFPGWSAVPADSSFGVSAKVFGSSLHSKTTLGFSADLAWQRVRFDLPQHKHAYTIVLKDVGFESSGRPAPFRLQAGGAYRIIPPTGESLTLSGAGNLAFDRPSALNLGAEYAHVIDLSRFFLRAGYVYERKGLGGLAGLSLGVGWHLVHKGGTLGMDYAWAPTGSLFGDTHRVSVSARFGTARPAEMRSRTPSAAVTPTTAFVPTPGVATPTATPFRELRGRPVEELRKLPPLELRKLPVSDLHGLKAGDLDAERQRAAAQAWFDEGMRRMLSREWVRAAESMRQASALAPENKLAQEVLRQAEEKHLGALRMATAAAARVPQAVRQRAVALFQEGRRALDRGQLLEARESFRKAAAVLPDEPGPKQAIAESERRLDAELSPLRAAARTAETAGDWIAATLLRRRAAEVDPERAADRDALAAAQRGLAEARTARWLAEADAALAGGDLDRAAGRYRLAAPAATKASEAGIAKIRESLLADAQRAWSAEKYGDALSRYARLEMILPGDPVAGAARDAVLSQIPARASELTSQASALRGQGKTQEAARQLDRALELDPDDLAKRAGLVDARVALGELAYRQNRLREAFIEWKLAQRIDPKNETIGRNLSRAESKLKLTDPKALKELKVPGELERAAREREGRVFAAVIRGRKAEAAGDVAAALRAYRDGGSSDPRHGAPVAAIANLAEVRVLDGEKKWSDGRHAEALAAFESGTRFGVDVPSARSDLERGRTALAAVAKALRDRAAGFTSRGLPSESVRALEEAWRLLPADRATRAALVSASTRLASFERRNGRAEEAARLWDRALELDPSNVEARDGLAALKRKSATERKREEEIRRRLDRARTLHDDFKYEDAALEFREALKIDRRTREAQDGIARIVSDLFELGQATWRAKDFEKAIDWWERGLRVDPTSLQTRDALSMARKFLTDEAAARLRTADGHLAGGRLAEAIAPLEEGIALDPTSPEIRSKLVRAAVDLGEVRYREERYLAAQELWKRADALQPGDTKVQTYLRRVDTKVKTLLEQGVLTLPPTPTETTTATVTNTRTARGSDTVTPTETTSGRVLPSSTETLAPTMPATPANSATLSPPLPTSVPWTPTAVRTPFEAPRQTPTSLATRVAPPTPTSLATRVPPPLPTPTARGSSAPPSAPRLAAAAARLEAIARAATIRGDLDAAVLSWRASRGLLLPNPASDEGLARAGETLKTAAETEWKAGRVGDALLAWRRAETLLPDDRAIVLAAAEARAAAPAEAQRLAVDGAALRAAGKIGEAAEKFEGALGADPALAAARTGLAEARTAEGEVHFRENRLVEAIRAWRQAKALDPESEVLSRYLPRAESKLKLSDPKALEGVTDPAADARAAREREVAMYASLAEADRARASGDSTTAEAAVRRALAMSPKHPAALAASERIAEPVFAAAEAEWDAGRHLSAFARFGHVLKLDPQHPEAKLALAEGRAWAKTAAKDARATAERSARAGDLDGAIAALDMSWGLVPGDPQTRKMLIVAHNARATKRAKSGRASEAAADYERVLKLEPGNVAAREGMKKVRRAGDQDRRRAETLRRTLATAATAVAGGRSDSAEQAYRAVLKVDTKNADALGGLSRLGAAVAQEANAAWSESRHPAAVRLWERAVALDPSNVEIRAALDGGRKFLADESGKRLAAAREALAAGRSADAAAAADDGLKLAPTNADLIALAVRAHLDLGETAYRANDDAGALVHWRRALALDPQSEKAKTYIRRAESRQKKK